MQDKADNPLPCLAFIPQPQRLAIEVRGLEQAAREGPVRVPANQLQALVRRHGLRLQSPSYTGEVVITMPDGVILKHELAREWRIGVERHRSGLIEILVA
jgi:hypothetical protein